MLSNIVLDDLDKELERRGLRLVRYADDCNIYVRSQRAGERVMGSTTEFITRKLKLKVNQDKSAVGKPEHRKFLGFRLKGEQEPKRYLAPQTLERLKARVRHITRRSRGTSVRQMIEQLTPYLRGWRAYFGFCQTPWVLREVDSWIRRRLRCVYWKQWKSGRTRFKQLRKRGVEIRLAAHAVDWYQSPWRGSRNRAISLALPNAYFDSAGLSRLYTP